MMTTINYYQTQVEDLAKTFCKICEKCYQNNLNTLVIVNNNDYCDSLDKSLWSYSKKHFIPHATQNDPRPVDHPIFITTIANNLNNAEILIFVNPTKQNLLDALSESSNIDFTKIRKTIFILDLSTSNKISEINGIIDKSTITPSQTLYFTKSKGGTWKETMTL